MTEAALLELVTAEEATRSPLFWSLDSKLPMLAAKAAVEIDWYIQKMISRFGVKRCKSIEKIHAILDKSMKAASGVNTSSFVDPLGISLIAHAYKAIDHNLEFDSRHDLIIEVDKVINTLSKVQADEIIEQAELQKTLDFLVALSQKAADYRETVYGNRQEHPFRHFQ
jgi:hypothetical protein